MRRSAFGVTVAVLAVMVLCGSQAQEDCLVKLSLKDAKTGRLLSGLIRIKDQDGKIIRPKGLLARGLGLREMGVKGFNSIHHWYVLPEPTAVQLPRGKFTIDAIAGLETDMATKSIDLASGDAVDATIELNSFYNAKQHGWQSANTHLHLMKLTRDQCDRYLEEIPKADGLDMIFLSYLERAVADREYTSNRYTDEDLANLTKQSGVVFGNGEEHRHNFLGNVEGYGHVMLLDIKKLIQPVSIGPGIMKAGNDGLPLRRGIDTARRDGAKVVWCHNDWGMESLSSWIEKKIHAQNIFDGGSHGSFKDSFYRYLNIGLKVPFSTGTDWFMYDFSRVYVQLDGPLTAKNWLNGLAAGRSYISNGPLLEFTVDGKPIGSTINRDSGGKLPVKARAISRLNFGEIQIVVNGEVIKTVGSQRVGQHWEAQLEFDFDASEPSWITLRTPPPVAKKDSDEPKQNSITNACGRELFAHTSPVYINIGGRGVWKDAVAKKFLADMESNHAHIAKNGQFPDAQVRARVLDVHADAIDLMKQRIQQH